MIALYLFVGFMVGGTVGVMVMCCFQATKEGSRREHEEKKNKNEDE